MGAPGAFASALLVRVDAVDVLMDGELEAVRYLAEYEQVRVGGEADYAC